MKTKNLNQEIKKLFSLVKSSLGCDSISYQNLDYYFDILVGVYTLNLDSDKDLLKELKNLLLKLSKEIPELEANQLQENFPNINMMIEYLDSNLSDC